MPGLRLHLDGHAAGAQVELQPLGGGLEAHDDPVLVLEDRAAHAAGEGDAPLQLHVGAREVRQFFQVIDLAHRGDLGGAKVGAGADAVDLEVVGLATEG